MNVIIPATVKRATLLDHVSTKVGKCKDMNEKRTNTLKDATTTILLMKGMNGLSYFQ